MSVLPRLLSAAVLLISLVSQVTFAQGETNQVERSRTLIKAIESKFGITADLTATDLQPGSVVEFRFKPPIPLVASDSEFISYNDAFVLGSLPVSTAEANKNLEAILRYSKPDIENLKLSQSYLVRDHFKLQHYFNLQLQIWPKEFTQKGAVLAVAAQLCQPTQYLPRALIGYIEVPISNLESLLAHPKGPLYDEGAAFTAIQQTQEVMARLDSLTRINIASEKELLKTDPNARLRCSFIPYNQGQLPHSWNVTRGRFLLPYVD